MASWSQSIRSSTTRWVWPDLSPLRHSASRERLKYQASPLSIVLRSASSFICATISTSPVAASVATQVTSPDASNLGWKTSPSSRSFSSADVDTESLAFFARSPLRCSHHGHEARLLRRIVAEHAGVAAGEGHRAMLGDAAHRHAGMLGLDHHGNAAGFEDLVDRGRDLRGEMLLGLQPPREDVGQPRQLRQAHHPLDRRIGDMRTAVERHHVVLALRGEFDVADEDEIVIAGGLAKGAVEHLGRTLVIALVEFVKGFDHPARRIEQALAMWILADIAQQRF